ncbi:MAG: hypothetical protein KC488_11390, partial [Candidatus Cloacimonetes bacterium]|nr:hypothetical protein [Candidatus Cloacimonadota bacterium]
EDPEGRAVALVDVVAVHPWRPDEVQAACSRGWQPGYWAWVLENVRAIESPRLVVARRGVYRVDEVTPSPGDAGRTPECTC